MSGMQGHATAAGTAAFAAAHAVSDDFYSLAGDLTVGSLGLGTYLGEADLATDRSYEEAIKAALELGINHLDTAIVYRGMMSERALGRALAASGVKREAVLVATKGGYVPSQLVREKKIPAEELVKGSHAIGPRSVEVMLERSLENMGLETVDIYYLHNPETQLGVVSEKELYQRFKAAFAVLEKAREKGKVVSYGTATWNGYRVPGQLQLEKVLEAARGAGGERHGFGWVQLPINLGMTEALGKKTQVVKGEPVTFMEAARRLSVRVVSSGSIAQGELAGDLARAIRFVRSVPGLTTALVGMSQAAHVRENVAAARAPKVTPEIAAKWAGLA
jgi:aryl-alcohol dehydrogenase-like predicted oxidoreductase